MKKLISFAVSVLFILVSIAFAFDGPAAMAANSDYIDGDVLHITHNTQDYRLASSSSPNWTTCPYENAEYREDIHTIIFEEGVTVIGAFSVYGLTNVKEVSLPSTLKEIHGDAFFDSYGLESITIPENVEVIGPKAFYGCQNLESAIFEGNAPAVSGYDYFSDSYSSSPPFGSNRSITLYYNSDKVWTTAKMRALCYNSSATWHDVNIIASGTCGENASWSYNKHRVLTITGRDSPDFYGSGHDTPWAAYNEEIEAIVVKEGITRIQSYTFEYMTHLKSVSLPSTLTHLACNAFNDCRELESITIPHALVEFSGDYYFYRCDALRDIYYIGTEDEWQAISNHQYCAPAGGEANYHFLTLMEAQSPTCTENGHESYYVFNDPGNSSIYSIDKKQISAIPELAALGHDWGSPVYEWNVDSSAVTAVRVCKNDADHVDKETADVSRILIHGPTETEMGEVSLTGAFDNIAFETQIRIVYIPALENLSVLRLPERLTEIGEEAFTHLTCEAVIIPDGCVQIGHRAFADCDKLIYVRIPASATNIEQDAFDGCNQVQIERTE